MAFLSRAADELEDALERPGRVPPRVADLVATARAVRSLRLACTPDEQFVTQLGQRLRVEAAVLLAPPQVQARAPGRLAPVDPAHPAPAHPAPGRPRAGEGPPVVILVGRGLPRALAGALVSALLVVAVLGVASRSALPGQALYPVRQLLDQVAVGLAGSPYDKGVTLLGQAKGHLGDAVRLVDSAGPADSHVDAALRGAARSLVEGRLLLRDDFTATRNARSLHALEDFARQASPLVDALRGRTPPTAAPLVDELRSLIAQTGSDAAQQLALCTDCGSASEATSGALQGGSSTHPTAVPGLSGDPTNVPVATVPGAGPSGTGATSSAPAGGPPVSSPASGQSLSPSLGVGATPALPTPGVVTVPGATPSVAPPGRTTEPGRATQSPGPSASLPPVSVPPVSLPPTIPSVSLQPTTPAIAPPGNRPADSGPAVSLPSVPSPAVDLPTPLTP